MFSFNNLYDSFKTNTEDEVLETYASVIRPKIKNLFLLMGDNQGA